MKLRITSPNLALTKASTSLFVFATTPASALNPWSKENIKQKYKFVQTSGYTVAP